MDFHTLFKNNEKWIEEKSAFIPNDFSDLAKGQTPEFQYIGSSDSRVIAEDLKEMLEETDLPAKLQPENGFIF